MMNLDIVDILKQEAGRNKITSTSFHSGKNSHRNFPRNTVWKQATSYLVEPCLYVLRN